MDEEDEDDDSGLDKKVASEMKKLN